MSDYPFPLLMPFDLAVTAEDIANGEPGNEQQCPIAFSLSRLLGDHYAISVDTDYAYVSDAFCGGGPVSWRLALPWHVSEWINLYDRELDVESITIQMPSESLVETLGPEDL